MEPRIVAGRRLIKARANEIFEVLADPGAHAEIDGSGMVRGRHDPASSRLAPGATFEMRMQQAGGRYRVINEVVEFAEPALIAWQVHPTRRLRRLRERLVGGHRWRYRLTEVPEGTIVEEEFDYSGARSPWALKLLRFPTRNAAAIERTLDHLEERFS